MVAITILSHILISLICLARPVKPEEKLMTSFVELCFGHEQANSPLFNPCRSFSKPFFGE